MDIWQKGGVELHLLLTPAHMPPTTSASSQQPTALVDKGPAPWQGAPIDGCDQAHA